MDYNHICSQVCAVAKEASAFIRAERENFDLAAIEYKGDQNLVSYVDKEAEKMIIARLLEIVPSAQIIGEEGTTTQIPNPNSQYKWIIDPLDGTTNFIHALPPYCVSIGLTDCDEIIVGVIYIVTSDECFYAYKGSKAYMNGCEISVSKVDKLENSLVISGIAYDLDSVQKNDFMRLFDHFNRTTHGARRLGSAAANLAYVAAGRAECFYQVNLSPWDVAAGALIVKQAGGCVTDFSGGDDFLFGKSIISANALLYNDFKQIINP